MATRRGWTAGRYDAITDVAGIRVGHWTNRNAATGCTVILVPPGATAAVDTRGGAPGTRETEALGPASVVQSCQAVVLTGGSAFGLASAAGVVSYLAEQDIGFPTSVRPVPVVPTAVLFDLGLGRSHAFPDERAGYRAAQRAKGGKVEQGTVGAGTGATVAKLLGREQAIKGGLGTASIAGPRGMVVGAIVACNAAGHIFDPDNGRLVAGPRGTRGGFVGLAESMTRRTAGMDALIEHTTLACIATNVAVGHRELQRLAIQAHDGLARAIAPLHTFVDGDVCFALGTNRLAPEQDDPMILGMMVSRAVEQAVLNSVRLATGLHGVPSATEWRARRR